MPPPAPERGGDAFDYERARIAGRMVLAVEGLWCVSCAMALQRVLERVAGVTSATVNFTSGTALVAWDPAAMDFAALLARARNLGYALSPLRDDGAVEAALRRQAQRLRMQLVVAAVFGMWSMLGSWVLYLNAEELAAQALIIGWASVAATLPVIGYGALDFFRAAWRSLRAGIAGMDVFASVAVLGSLALSAWNLATGVPDIYTDAATMLVTFLLIGRLIEIQARQQSRLAMEALRGLAPETVMRLDRCAGGPPQCVLLADVHPGEHVVVRANERVAVDGLVLAGTSTLDLSLLTGESMPQAVAPGAEVFAGATNLLGPLTVEVRAAAGARRLDLLGLRMLELFGGRSSLSETAERFVRVLLPAMLAASGLALAYYLWRGVPTQHAVLGALSILVAACPCAVGLAMPLAYALACRQAARRGVLLRDPASLEALGRARTIAFDKTGTLTEGRLRVASVTTAPGWSEEGVLALAAAAEAGVVHPIALALTREAAARGLPAPDLASAHLRAMGRGVVMTTADGEVRVGDVPWLREAGVAVPTALDGQPGSVSVARDGRWIGAVHLEDGVRADTAAGLRTLRSRGLEPWLLTGDSAEATARLLATLEMPFSRVETRCTPEAKAALIGQGRRPAAFVGDGANDALVLARADCGIAIPGASTVAVAAAGIVVTHGGVGEVVAVHRLAQKFSRIVRQNLVFSVVYNILVVALFLRTGATPFAAALAMLASSLSVLLNTCRLLGTRSSVRDDHVDPQPRRAAHP